MSYFSELEIIRNNMSTQMQLIREDEYLSAHQKMIRLDDVLESYYKTRNALRKRFNINVEVH